MKKPLIIHGAWTLLAAGAYFAGTYNPRSVPDSAPSRSLVAGAPSFPQAAGAAGQIGNAKNPTAARSAEAVRWLDSFRSPDGAISAERMKEAVLAAMRDPDPVKSMLNFAQLLAELTPDNAPAALKAVTESAGSDSVRYLSLLAHAWGEKDGKTALAALDALRRRDAEGAKSTALAAWAATDPDAALKWLQDRNAQKDAKADPRQDAALARGMITGLARRDVDGALKYLMTLSEGQQGDYVGLLVEQKMKESVAAGAEWAESLPNERMRVNGMEVAGGQFLRRDLDGAVQWAEKIAARPDAHEAVADIANEMANRNGQEAAAWVAKLPAGPSQNHAFEDVFETWTRADPLAASQSLTNLTPGPGRDAAIQAFSNTLARENPTDALTWASVISDPKERVDLQLNIARRWNTNAPTEAQAWITANLPPDLQAQALAPQRR